MFSITYDYFSTHTYIDHFRAALELMNPKVELELMLQPSTAPDDLNIRIMSGDASFNFFHRATYQLNNLLENDYYINLSQYEEINMLFDDMFPQVKEGLVYNNTIYGFPIEGSYFETLYYDINKLSEIGYDINNEIYTISRQIYNEEISIDEGVNILQDLIDLYSEEYTLSVVTD